MNPQTATPSAEPAERTRTADPAARSYLNLIGGA